MLRIRIVLMSIFMCCAALGSEDYFLCGPDEDGCYPGIYQWCLCEPKSVNSSEDYCLNFNRLACEPLSEHPDCPEAQIQPDQAHCLATLWQSEPEPLCAEVSREFCLKQHIPLCRLHAGVESCH